MRLFDFFDFFTARPTPRDKFFIAMKACDKYFKSIDGVQGDQIIAIRQDKVEYILFGSDQARDIEWAKRHATHCPGYAVMWASATRDRLVRAEKWIPFKRLGSGEVVWHPWAAQHEDNHYVDLLLRLDDRDDDMSNPDNLTKEYIWTDIDTAWKEAA